MALGDDEVTVTLTVPAGTQRWVKRMDAKRWLQQVIRGYLQKSAAQWEVELRAVIPLGHSVQGMKYKIIFEAVPSHLLNDVIFPALREHGLVKQHSRE